MAEGKDRKRESIGDSDTKSFGFELDILINTCG